MKKFIVGLGCIALLSVLTGGCLSSGVPGLSPQPVVTQAAGNGDCILAGQGGPVGIMDQIKAKALNKLVDYTTKEILGVEDVFLIQNEITDTCMADQYLGHIDKKTSLLANASQNILTTMADSFESQEKRKEYQSAVAAMKQDLEDGDKKDAYAKCDDGWKAYSQAIEDGAKVDKVKLATIWTDVKNISVRNIEVLSLGKHLASFAKENSVWAIKNFKGVKTVFSAMGSIAQQTMSIGSALPLMVARCSNYDASILKKAKKNSQKGLESRIADDKGVIKDAANSLD